MWPHGGTPWEGMQGKDSSEVADAPRYRVPTSLWMFMVGATSIIYILGLGEESMAGLCIKSDV